MKSADSESFSAMSVGVAEVLEMIPVEYRPQLVDTYGFEALTRMNKMEIIVSFAVLVAKVPIEEF